MVTNFSFRDLRVWQESKKLACDIFKNLEGSKKYSLVDQITRSAISIPSNISEGFERKWQAEFIQFLYIAKWSCAECITQLEICWDIGVINRNEADLFIKQAEDIQRMIMSLIAQEKTSSKRL